MAGVSAIALSADGRLVAVSAGEFSPDHKIYITDRSGRSPRKVSGATEGCDRPVFSPDGQYVYFLSESWPKGFGGEPTVRLMRTTLEGGVQEVAPAALFERPLSQ